MIITLTPEELSWLRAMPPHTKTTGIAIEGKFEALQKAYKEMKEEAELWENRYEKLLQSVGGVSPG